MSTQIHDLGYRSYDGERAGVPWAVRSLALHSVRRALGLKRAGRHKIVPAVTIALAFFPALVMIGLAFFLPGFGPTDLVTYGEYFGLIAFALFLFTAASAPGVLTTDRTNGMLAMYLASPLTRTTYVLAKVIGIFAVMLLVTVAPILFLIIANTLVGSGPGGIFDFIEIMARALAAGTILAALLTGTGLFISSIPRRWGIASVSIIGAFLIPVVVAEVLTQEAGYPDWVAAFSPGDVVLKSAQHILGDVIDEGIAIDQLDGTFVVLAAIAYAVAFLGLTWWRYQRIEVER